MQRTELKKVSIYDLKIFALILTTGFLILGGLIPYLKNRSFILPLIFVGVLVFLVGAFSPKLLILPRKYWIHFGNLMGKINSTILFTLMYFIVFSFVGVIFRLSKRDRLKTGFRKVSTTMVWKNEITPFEDPF